jgi:hypothetical protein
MYLPRDVSKARLREAENARRYFAELATAITRGEVSRRDFIKWGLATSSGLLVPVHGLSPFTSSAYADQFDIPTGLPPSPLFGVLAFTQPMPRFDVLPRKAFTPGAGVMNPIPAYPGVPGPDPTPQANTTLQPVPAVLGGGKGPIEGRPPGPIWAHQQWTAFPPRVVVEVTQEGAKANKAYNPGVPSGLNSGIDASTPLRPAFHPGLPDQGPLALWTFNGTLPPKLLIGTTAITGRRTTVSPGPISSPASSTTTTTRSSTAATTASTRARPIPAAAAPTTPAASTGSPATTTRP